MKKGKVERIEALIRIIVFIVSGVMLLIWRFFIYMVVFVNLIYTLLVGRRMKDLADMAEIWNTQMYVFQRYLIFESNIRPFPFGKIQRDISRFRK